MKGFSCLLLALVCFLGQHSCGGRVPLNPFPFGTIGCLVSDVCDSGDVCTNDLLFGSCQNIFTRALSGDIKFHLERREITRLEKEIRKLIKDGFTWKDAFTQCALQNTLLEFSRGRLFDPRRCEEALGVSSSDLAINDMNEEIANILTQLLANENLDLTALENMAIDDNASEESDLLNSNKRDEIVQVHKYFDKSKGQLKRDPLIYQKPSSEYLYLPSETNEESRIKDRLAAYYSDNSQQNSAEENSRAFPFFNTDEDLSSNNFNQLESFSKNTDDSDSSLSESTPLPEDLGLDGNMEEPLSTSSEGDEAFEMDPDSNVVSVEDEKKLGQLLDGTLKPEDLNPEEQQRIQVFIEKLIKVLDVPATQEEDMQQSPVDGFVPEEDLAEEEVGEVKEAEEQPSYSEEEESPEQVDKKSTTLHHVVYPTDYDGQEEKSADSGTGNNNTAKTQKEYVEPIDSHSMYFRLSKGVDQDTGMMFIHNLSKEIQLPYGMIGSIKVGPEDLITLTVNTDPSGEWDAESIARKALKSKDKLKTMTGGITVESAFIGQYDGNGVEFKQNNRYVVLTFILVGSIAGVMLAVVTIYVIKRHTRSKQKLAQLASNPDGTEVSKDYQDLCRQRMQGKSSEKPEPLHAASRIGSTSESQVRSPSSRSSTSSWSEEPAATNMDISTGHIVLSYMEDHLKNQNRLDKEWEAVSNYVADPASTKVATDQSNMRKNRFADILPYDHSRVVLSSNANVANSDYINASFITDHDPRNPAYICTQGPLPHTVADFWQMIWEQGSVVIVMLTKLAENGTGLCHRYWPEEGSDLYHIYEVHLVSEHIWCDDYLVRSFYLKNLQTNETRTVTQFHFLTWPQLSVPASIKTLLDFRRKVNKSFRGRSCPIVVHCSDGCGRSGTYCLVDMVLNKMAKGAKEIDMAATLEHIRDQRMNTVKTKEQFQFSLAAVAEEVHAILKALPQ